MYPQFVNATVDSTTKESKVTGFCIDVFDAVLRRLDYALPYEVVAYHIHDNDPDDFLYQIYHKFLSLLRLFSIVFSFLFIIFYIYCRTVILLKFLYLWHIEYHVKPTVYSLKFNVVWRIFIMFSVKHVCIFEVIFLNAFWISLRYRLHAD